MGEASQIPIGAMRLVLATLPRFRAFNKGAAKCAGKPVACFGCLLLDFRRMEFGKLDNISDVDWSLPPDDPLNEKHLSAPGALRETEIFFGAPAWAHAEWVGVLYPPGTKRADFLHRYSRYFSTIELNTVHYQIPSKEKVEAWISQVPSDFLFCPKMNKEISHARNGLLDRALIDRWIIFLQQLGPNRGPCFLQLPPHFSYAFKSELFSFLQNWPDGFELAIEFRHPSWFEGGRLLPALAEYLNRRRVGAVITDVAGRRDVLHTTLATDFSMLRFIGNDLHASDFTRAQLWSERFVKWREQGLKRIFLFIHEPDDLRAPEMTAAFLQTLHDKGGWNFPSAPSFEPTEKQLSLLGDS